MRYLIAVTALLACLAPGAFAAPSITAAVNTRIRDLQATAAMADANLPALTKIGKDYANSYRAKTMVSYFQEPGRMRFEAKGFGITFTQVISGNLIYTSVMGIRAGKPRDISRSPQARLTSLEIGFITPSALKDFTAKYLRQEKICDTACQVYELRYRMEGLERKKILLWVDPAHKVLVRRELYHDDGSLKARFTYLNPKQVKPGIWVPTRITVHNADGELGGVTHYGGFRVNTGLAASLFQGP